MLQTDWNCSWSNLLYESKFYQLNVYYLMIMAKIRYVLILSTSIEVFNMILNYKIYFVIRYMINDMSYPSYSHV